MAGVRQVNSPCPSCGSYYRRGDKCNICGEHAPVIEQVQDDSFVRRGRQPTGQIWDSQKHRYVKRSDSKI